jgi:hypothetical protein
MVRKEDGLFRGRGFNSNITKLSEAFFSLLKFDPSDDDDDFSKNCLVANLSVNSKYLNVFPVDCDSKIANSFICLRFFSYCGLYKNQIQEQIDLLFDPVQKQNLDYYIMKETNEIHDTIKSLNRLLFIFIEQGNSYTKIGECYT